VASWHHGDPPSAAFWSRWFYGPRRLGGLVLLSDSLAAAARTRLGWPAERLAVAPGSVDGEHFAPRPPALALREELGLKPGERVLGVVARLQPHRRFELLLEAVRRAREIAPELRLVVVGRGSRARSVVEEPVEKLGLEQTVVRAGYRRGDYRDVLSLFDALVFLVPGSDGSCRAVLESMAMGIPTVASRRGLLPELVADGVTGTLVDEHPEALAAAMVDVARQPEAWRARGVAARARALERHPIGRTAGALAGLYSRLVELRTRH
jgi:glycosyltransferase involved in cell wall biosynthesis